jgi:hypothetical protein
MVSPPESLESKTNGEDGLVTELSVTSYDATAGPSQ